MAIYHLEAKVVSRGTGRSAVAASAYLSCTNILNDYDGVRHDYTRKKGLIWREVFLPEYAPPEWKDRGVLWNAVEENEKTKDSRLAREFVPALPVELTPTQWQELLSDFIILPIGATLLYLIPVVIAPAYLTGIHPLASVMGIYPHISEAAAAMVESLMQGVLFNTSPLVCVGSLLLIGATFAAASVVALKKQSY